MVFIYGFCDGNSRSSVQEYARRFPNRRTPNRQVFTDLFNRLRETGCVRKVVPDGVVQTPVEVENDILHSVQQSPGTSVRKLSRQHLVSISKTWRILHNEGLYPYHLRKVQALHAGDTLRRSQFCRWVAGNRHQIKFILFTDEAQFTRNGINNSKNVHIWAEDNPHATVETNFQQRFSVNVWCGLLNDKLVGPHILDGAQNGVSYLHFLNNTLPELLEDVAIQSMARMFYQHDGAPPHRSRAVVETLRNRFEEKLIAHQGPVNWPPRSPDLTPMDYFLWGYMKTEVYRSKPQTREELVEKIHTVAETIKSNPIMIRAATLSLVKRARLCLSKNGGHFENLIS
ncbi:uncharacterized protein LOC128997489 [Macrosteles quadrilineatus]|uniref:uncharacterized protein LOC128997489 n=1 Tax=Macrosteles quadrilineatus TaxID=74068 RepID=UPI0023E2E19C|nr:uncharacterized protein LOC128997489 [Macrosteles quadrilineatus]